MRQLTICATLLCLLVSAAAPAGARSSWQVPWRIVGTGSYLGGRGLHLPQPGQPALAPGVFIEPDWQVTVVSSAAELRAVVSDINSRIGATLHTATTTDFRSRRLLVFAKNYPSSGYGLTIDSLTSVGNWARLTVHDTVTTCPEGACASMQAYFSIVRVLSVPRKLFPVPAHLALSVGPLVQVTGP